MNQESTHHIDELLAKKLLDEASPDELKEVATWVNKSPENAQYFQHFQLIWAQSKALAASSNVDTEQAWQRFQRRIEQPSLPSKTISLNFRAWARIAASLLLLIAVSGGVYYFGKNRGIQTIASGGVTRTQTLPDGSIVMLNKNASISYPKNFNGNKRVLQLIGEAFFKITADKNKPFIIEANGVNVTVVGTSFNVKSSDEKTEVIVETGIVEVKNQQSVVTLNPHEQAIARKNDARVTKQQNKDQLYNYYRTREFECNNTPLYRLVEVLNEAYHADIVIADNKLRFEPVTSRYSSEDSLENILKLLSESHGLNVEQNDNQFILKPR